MGRMLRGVPLCISATSATVLLEFIVSIRTLVDVREVSEDCFRRSRIDYVSTTALYFPDHRHNQSVDGKVTSPPGHLRIRKSPELGQMLIFCFH